MIPVQGMPVQVFPTPPPPPPKLPPPNSVPVTQPDRKPSPNSFVPPPLGCRPEIKIPPNPMAALKPTPKPVVKDDFWVEEYRRESRSRSPMNPQTEGNLIIRSI